MTDENQTNHEEEVFEDVEFVDSDEQGQEQSHNNKLKSLREELKEVKAQRDEYLTGWQRAKADAINQKKEFDERIKNLTKFATINCIEDFLPVYDSFYMAMKNKTAWEAVESQWRAGVEYIFNQFNQVLEKHSVTVITNTNVELDTSIHEPLDTQEVTTEAEANKVIEIKQVGFKQGDVVIRPAKVVVTVLVE